ncbi:hypothetical protein LXT12_14810 [Pelomonas sp. P7]|uniref:Uncharacterized protein n=1 Tax=Pelomonas caseinilytica TaxID=2906763 RepID=A0ABS8XIZ8_9BURK|nr:hypothetical protein [Pelomonas sp. P7]MCE4538521.1 hypothetical protein [Pelomonas sp. P7]
MDQMISIVSADHVVQAAATGLGLNVATAHEEAATEALLAGAVRRIAGVRAPCSARTLVFATKACLAGVLAEDGLSELIEHVVDRLLTNGDLLELSSVSSLDESLPQTSLFVAPPSFVRLEGGDALLFGMSEEDAMPLPDDLRRRVVHRGVRRILLSLGADDIAQQLLAYGYREQSLDGWLRMPAKVAASELLSRTRRILAKNPSAGQVEGLALFGGDASMGYSKRWCEPKGNSGSFVARRSQAYGSKRWCFVEVQDGDVSHLVDLPLAGEAFRGCDAAWRLLHALEAENGHPSHFDLVTSGASSTIKLYCPIPMWAERRLELSGIRIDDSSCLLAFRFANASSSGIVDFLQDNLWLRRRTS